MTDYDTYHLLLKERECPLFPDDEEYVSWHQGTIVQRAPQGPPQRVGAISGFVIEAGRALDNGADVFDSCDASDELSLTYARAFYGKDGSWKQTVSEFFDGPTSGHNLLVIHQLAIAPAHRGHHLGLLAARRLIDLVGGGCGLVAYEPVPRQFLAPPSDEPVEPEAEHAEQDEQKARRKLAAYLSRLGSVQVAGTSYYALSLDWGLPSVEDLRKKPPRSMPLQTPTEPARPAWPRQPHRVRGLN